MGLKWGFLLEFRQSIRTKKFWAIVILMTVMYIPSLYGIKSTLSYYPVRTLQYAMTRLISFTGGMGMFFVSILAIIVGAVAINSEINKGTLRIAISKPIKRWQYMFGKLLAHASIIAIALGISAVVVVVGMRYLGFSITADFIRDVLSLNGIVLLAMIQLLALGYLLSTFIRSEGASMGAAIAILFIVFMIVPAIVQFYAYDKAIRETSHGGIITNQTLMNRQYDKIMSDYRVKYLFFDPLSQVKGLLTKISEHEHVIVTNITYYQANMTSYQANGSNKILTFNTSNMTIISSYVIKRTGKGACTFGEASGESPTFMNGEYIVKENVTSCYDVYVYKGVPYSVSKNLKNLWILIGMTGVYLLVAFYRFIRMDLR